MRGISIQDVTFRRHFLIRAREKGFTAEQIRDAIEQPYQITDVRAYPGQDRYCGRMGAAVVMDGNVAITIYEDGVVTPMREDQRNDPRARASSRLNGLNRRH